MTRVTPLLSYYCYCVTVYKQIELSIYKTYFQAN